MAVEIPTGGNASSDGAPTARDAYEHAWNWFKFHGEQRLTMIRFSVLILGAIAVGIYYLHKDEENVFSLTLSIFGTIVAYSFLRLDLRTADLIKLGEQALSEREAQIAQAANSSKINIFKATDTLRHQRCFPYTYRQNFRLLFICVITLYLLIAGYSVFLIIKKCVCIGAT
jgi:hypothetical protein